MGRDSADHTGLVCSVHRQGATHENRLPCSGKQRHMLVVMGTSESGLWDG